MRVGDVLSTPYGEATLAMYRETDHVYVLNLPYGKLYANKEALQPKQEESSAEMRKAMELNEAYEALEKMRRFNLEVSCQECGIQPNDIDYEECSACLLEGAIAARESTVAGRMSSMFRPKADSIPANMTRLKSFVAQREKSRKPPPCLSCGTPSCSKHASETFRKEGITQCKQCENVFKMEFVVDCMTLDKKERRARVDKLIDLYDRCSLLLTFSSEYMDNLIGSLEENKDRDNKINFGGSSAGIASGILGVAAAATLITPAGVPLLVASLMLGTAATGVQTGTEVNSKYFSEPHKLADRILALHGMLLSILSVTGTLRDAATRDFIRSDAFDENSPIFTDLQMNHIGNRPQILAGMTAGRFAVGSAELLGLTEGAAIARSARMFSRSGTAAMRTLRFARFAGGALAAATLVVEANSMANTVKSIKEGSPCDKADSLRKIKQEMPDLPITSNLDKECNAYLAHMDQRGRRMKEEEAVKLLLEVAKEEVSTATGDTNNGELILEASDEAEEGENHSTPRSSPQAAEEPTGNMSGSLMERIQLFKHTATPSAPAAAAEQEPPPVTRLDVERADNDGDSASTMSSASSSLFERIEAFKKSRTATSTVSTS